MWKYRGNIPNDVANLEILEEVCSRNIIVITQMLKCDKGTIIVQILKLLNACTVPNEEGFIHYRWFEIVIRIDRRFK